MNNQETIYYLKNEDVLNKEILYNCIYNNMDLNYYWSNDFSEEFYINLAKAGFITVSNYFDGELVLLPELQFEYAILDFDNLHISKKVKKLINKNEYILTFNENFENLLHELEKYHDNCWIRDKYLDLIKNLKDYYHKTVSFEIISVELICKNSKNLIAGELGYIIGSTYTSLTGFCKRDKKYNNIGNLQLVLLAKYLKTKEISFWNLGHANMDYKTKLGAKVFTRIEFLKRWLAHTQE